MYKCINMVTKININKLLATQSFHAAITNEVQKPNHSGIRIICTCNNEYPDKLLVVAVLH